ncbi:ATP-binding protein [Candidatus Venteria ishoeyi]|uniref:Putative AAA-ATPase n=1 Tax=Candidatus Venteria ishoeyi TaxID=1899563 RepID=A0A1H6FIF8_9GAMM|nr:ATP-binding protein [Candidatus Venteria ishoeyi]SEH08906.1 putative AAA-ATPase [Candidatus Venteria ishoeyi]
MKKLPLGIQTFAKIRDTEENYVYVDKTKLALELINNSGYYFLSRPRRFGKSLFLDTLKAIFEGRKELFSGLYIEDKWDWSRQYPVIKLSFGAGLVRSQKDLDNSLLWLIDENQERLGLQCKYYKEDIKNCFLDLIKQAYQKYQQQVVILVDEYDKPILDNITDTDFATQMRDGLKHIYSVIKDSDPYIKFVLLTGVSKFSKVSLFSGLNNLKDISLVKDYATICGYTHADVLQSFHAHLLNADVNLEQLRNWYNGYHFLGEGVYNPYDILLFFDNHGEYRNYWIDTGNPSFLIEILRKKVFFIPDLDNLSISEADLGSFDVDDIKIETLLFQAGYLTIKEVKTIFNQRVYQLSYPNLEVRSALNDIIFKYLLSDHSIAKLPLFNAILERDMEQFENAVYELFASIPYNNYVNNDIQNYEGYYASVMYSYLAGLGIQFIAEDVTHKGRIDITIATPDMSQVYVIEFKVIDKEKHKGNAITQIKQQKYYEKYQATAKLLYIVGIEFCKMDKNICGFEWEQVVTDNSA